MRDEKNRSLLDRGESYVAARGLLFGAAVFFLALALRLAYLNQMHLGIYSNLLKMEGTDSFLFLKWSFTLAEQGWLAHTDIDRSILYPYFLGLVFKVFGTKVYIARLVQMLMGSFTCLMVYVIGRRSFSPLAGLAGGILAAAYGPLIFYDGAILRANMAAFLNTLFVLMMIVYRDRPGAARYFLTGLVYGLCILAKPNALILIPGIAAWIYLARKKTGMPKMALAALVFTIGSFIPLSLNYARNAALGIDTFSLTTKGAAEFISGNIPQSPGIGWHVPEEVEEIEKRAEGSMIRVMIEVLRENRADPLEFIKQQLRKTGAFLNEYEVPNNISMYVEKRYVPFMRLSWPGFNLALALGIIGILAGLKRWRDLLPLYAYILLYSIGTIAFYILARFRIPVVPVLLVFSGAGIMMIIKYPLMKKWPAFAALVVFAACIFLLARSNVEDPLLVSDYYNMARYHIISGQPEKAAEIWKEGVERALKTADEKPSAKAHYRAAIFIIRANGDPRAAMLHVREARKFNPPKWMRFELEKISAMADSKNM